MHPLARAHTRPPTRSTYPAWQGFIESWIGRRGENHPGIDVERLAPQYLGADVDHPEGCAGDTAHAERVVKR